jgi:hypothetical protein
MRTVIYAAAAVATLALAAPANAQGVYFGTGSGWGGPRVGVYMGGPEYRSYRREREDGYYVYERDRDRGWRGRERRRERDDD